MPFEDELGQALRRTGDTFSTDQQRLSDTGRARGRRRLYRRRAGAVTGSVAALALVGVGGAWTGGLLGEGADGGRGQVAAPRTTHPTPGLGDTIDEKRKQAERGVITEQWMADTFRKLLPEGVLSNVSARGSGALDEPMSNPSVSAVYDDGKGRAAMSLDLSRVARGSQEARQRVTCPARTHIRYDTCSTEKDVDGSMLMTLQTHNGANGAEQTKRRQAILVSPNGLVVDASEWNAPAENGATVSRPDPPLTIAALKELVSDGRWTNELMGVVMDRERAGRRGFVWRMDGVLPEIATPSSVPELVALVPRGLKVSNKGGELPGEASLVADDGKGAGMVDVKVQVHMGAAVDGLAERGDSVTELPNGTKVIVSERAVEKGAAGVVVRTVDVINKDGKRVLVSAYNAASPHSAPTRERPVLTVAQLKTIAAGSAWWE